MEVLSSNLKIIEPDSASFTGLDCFSWELELAIARFVAKSRKIEKSNVSNDFGLGGVMVSYVCGVKILLNKQKIQRYWFSVLLMIFRCKFNLTFCMSIDLKIHQFFTINLWIDFQSSRVSISTGRFHTTQATSHAACHFCKWLLFSFCRSHNTQALFHLLDNLAYSSPLITSGVVKWFIGYKNQKLIVWQQKLI